MLPTSLRRAAVAAMALTATLSAQQSKNTTLLARFDPTSSYSDIWGYVAPNGKEYALLAARSGTYVVDCTNPQQPVQRGFFSGSSSCCRDIRTYRHYAYVVNEGGGGLQIIDLQDPDQPRLVRNWSTGDLRTAHNVAIDTQTGTLYAAGATSGMPIVDLSQDPENPTQIGNLRTPYVHDLCIQDGYAHLAYIFNGRYSITDVGNLPAMTQVGSLSVSVAHNAWPSRDNQIAALTSETSGGNLTVVDISNRRLPRRIATWRTGRSSTTPHNAYMYDRVCHISWYSEGYHAVDLSNPNNPTEVAWYDTSGSTTGQTGNWGCYPFQPSGTVYLSDFSGGLYVLDSLGRPAQYGQGTSGQGQREPQIHAFGAAWHGNSSFKLQLEDGQPNSTALFVMGVSRATTNVLGITLLVDLGQQFFLVPTQTDADGHAEVTLPIPAAGPTAVLHGQWLVVDAGAPGGIAASRGLSFDVFNR